MVDQDTFGKKYPLIKLRVLVALIWITLSAILGLRWLEHDTSWWHGLPAAMGAVLLVLTLMPFFKASPAEELSSMIVSAMMIGFTAWKTVHNQSIDGVRSVFTIAILLVACVLCLQETSG